MYETLLTDEECANAIDLGNFYRVPADKRDLNYDKYFFEGMTRNTLTQFNSNNTNLMDVEAVKNKLLEVKLVRDELNEWGRINKMKDLISGAKGFVGQNLVAALKNIKDGKERTRPSLNIEDIYEYDIDSDESLLDTLKKYDNKCGVMLSSSIQATLIGRYADSDYGKSKLVGENLFFDYANKLGIKVYVYRFPNLFGKWCKC